MDVTLAPAAAYGGVVLLGEVTARGEVALNRWPAARVFKASLPTLLDEGEPLIRGRATLAWDYEAGRVFLQLPGVARSRLPAVWRVGDKERNAAATPDIFLLNSAAFATSLSLTLEAGRETESQRLPGLRPWRLFDSDRGTFIHNRRRQLPPGKFLLISEENVHVLCRRGFDEFDANEPYELEDDKSCCVTQLVPTSPTAEASFLDRGATVKLSFGTLPPLATRVFFGLGFRSAQFARYGERVIVGHAPVIVLKIPPGFVKDGVAVEAADFRVYAGERESAGRWNRIHADSHFDYHVWEWADVSQPLGDGPIRVEAEALGLGFEHDVEHSPHAPELDEAWKNVPQDLLEWFLLSQEPERGMKWDEILLAQKVIFPGERKPRESLLRRYADVGLLKQKAKAWTIVESRAAFREPPEGYALWSVRYCGDLSILWGVFRRVHGRFPGALLTPIGSAQLSGLPYVLTFWRGIHFGTVRRYLMSHGVRVVSQLW
jgi:hypothetical protein